MKLDPQTAPQTAAQSLDSLLKSVRCTMPKDKGLNGDLLGKYATDGELRFALHDVLKVPPISHHSNVNEIIGKFSGADQLRNAVHQLQPLWYAA